MNAEGVHMGHGACASCKHQRRRCDDHCELAKYFPANKMEDFMNVYKLFGVNNMLRILHAVDYEDRDKTAETIIMEARIRHENPVHGSITVQEMLRTQIDAAEKELKVVKKQVSAYKNMRIMERQRQEVQKLYHQSSALSLNLELNTESMPMSRQQFGNYHNQPNQTRFGRDGTGFNGFNYRSTMEEGEEIKLHYLPLVDEVEPKTEDF